MCKCLPGLHTLPGCEYNPSFYKKGKIRPFKLPKNNVLYEKALAPQGGIHILNLRDKIF